MSLVGTEGGPKCPSVVERINRGSLVSRSRTFRKAYMLRSQSDQVANFQTSFTSASLHYCPKELPSLREANRVEMARRVEFFRGDFGKGEKLLAYSGNLLVRSTEEGGTPA
jgi:hypothetical protein